MPLDHIPFNHSILHIQSLRLKDGVSTPVNFTGDDTRHPSFDGGLESRWITTAE